MQIPIQWLDVGLELLNSVQAVMTLVLPVTIFEYQSSAVNYVWRSAAITRAIPVPRNRAATESLLRKYNLGQTNLWSGLSEKTLFPTSHLIHRSLSLLLGPSPSTLVGGYQTKGGSRGGSMFLKKLSGSSAVPASVDSSSYTLDLPKPCTCTGKRHWLAIAQSQLLSILLPLDLQLNKSLLTSLVPFTPII